MSIEKKNRIVSLFFLFKERTNLTNRTNDSSGILMKRLIGLELFDPYAKCSEGEFKRSSLPLRQKSVQETKLIRIRSWSELSLDKEEIFLFLQENRRRQNKDLPLVRLQR